MHEGQVSPTLHRLDFNEQIDILGEPYEHALCPYWYKIELVWKHTVGRSLETTLTQSAVSDPEFKVALEFAE